MAYTIQNTDGSTLLLLADNTTDTLATSLTLVGKNVSSYGEYLNNNLIKILGNSANIKSIPPTSPLTGQLWYDTTARRLKVYDNGFKAISGAIISATLPTNLSAGDLWFDSANNQLTVYSGSAPFVIGPTYPKAAGENGWVLPATGIKDDLLNKQNVTLLKSYGQFIGIASAAAFNLSSADSLTYFNTSTSASVVSGISIMGDLSVTGQLTSNYLSTYADIDKIAPANRSISAAPDVAYQNHQINALLEKLFPVTASSIDVGVPLGSEARVVCAHSMPTAGTQVRRFKIVNQPAIGISWQPHNVYATNTSNIVP